MMAFNPAAFSQAQLLASQQPTTPLKPDSDPTADALRYLASAGGLMSGQFQFPGMPPNMDALRTMIPNGGLPFPMLYPGMQQEGLGGGGPFPAMMFGGEMGFHPYGLDGARRKNATRETTMALKDWLHQHKKNPYPTKAEKVLLAMMTKMSMTQVSTWFANARRRLKKENKWSPPNRRGDEGDDDDMDGLDRPGSSSSNNQSINDDVDTSMINESETVSLDEVSTPKKKIWSIVDEVKSSDEKKPSSEELGVGCSKKESPSSDESLSQFALLPHQQHQLMAAAMSRLPFNPQHMFAAMQAAQQHQQQQQQPVSPNRMAPFIPFNALQLMALSQQQAALNGSFSSDAASVSPSSSRSPSQIKASPKMELPASPEQQAQQEN